MSTYIEYFNWDDCIWSWDQLDQPWTEVFMIMTDNDEIMSEITDASDSVRPINQHRKGFGSVSNSKPKSSDSFISISYKDDDNQTIKINKKRNNNIKISFNLLTNG